MATTFFSARSRGEVTLRPVDPTANPNVQHNYLSDPLDMLIFSEACRVANEIAVDGAGTKDVVIGSWPAAQVHDKYTTREEWREAIRQRADTCYHPGGTCKMGKATDEMAVVDADLRDSRSTCLSQPDDTPVSGTTPTRSERYGLFLLSDATTEPESRDIVPVDIVAIHGLNGDAYSTWEHENGTLWLRDLLPSALPGSRVFTYGYPSQLFFSRSVASLRDYSQRLLSSLIDVCIGDAQRPIIFVCHSLGGIVCKQAIVLAHEEDHRYGRILAATSSIVFFGTPHRGAQGIADIGKTIGSVVNACLRVSQTAGLTGVTRTDILKTLTADSESLKDLSLSFRNRLDKIDVVTFLETMPVPPLSDLIVNRHSAIMEIRNEEIIPMYSDHVGMCRFGGKSQEYGAVSNALIRLARVALKRREMTATSRDSSDRSLSEAERSCMVLLHSVDLADYKADLPRPVQGTCKWILSHPDYLSWIQKEATSLLWVTGNPGCGKTMLSAFLTENLKLDSAASSRSPVYYFFCDDKIVMQRDASAIIRSILYQMLQQHRRLIKHVKVKYESYGPSLTTSFSALWELFLKLAGELKSGPLGVIIDALDECEEKTRRSFLNAVMRLVDDSQGVQRHQQNWIKFLITSRPSLGNIYNFKGFVQKRLPIEQDQDRVNEDVRLVIKSKVEEIARKLECPEETKAYLQQVLYSKADHTFLWLDLILQRLEDTSLASKKEIEQIVNTFPRDLETTYGSFWQRIPPGSRTYARKTLSMLVESSRPLSLAEFNTAVTIDDSHDFTSDVQRDRQFSISRTLQNTAGPFIRIQSSTVSLLHQSAKEFLTGLAMRSQDPVIRNCGISSTDAALSLAWPCIQYLLLQDFTKDHFVVNRTSFETDSPDSPLMAFSTMALDDLLGLEEDRVFKDQSALEEETCSSLTQQYDFFDYSATHWAEHFARCENSASGGLRHAVHQLVETNSCVLKNWLKYFWIKKNLEYPYPDDFDSIMVAAFFDFPSMLRALLESDQTYEQSRRDRALFWAARMGCPGSVGVLLDYCGDPNRQTIDLHTPVTIAAEFGHFHAVQTLLECTRTSLDYRGKSGRSALSFAAGNGHIEIVKLLMGRKDCQVEGDDASKWTPLFWAVGGDHIAVIESLLDDPSVNLNRPDKDGRSVLSWAAGDGLLKASKSLLRHPRVDVNLKDATGRTPLLWAAGNGHSEIVTAFMRNRRVDRSSKDDHQRNAISWACQGGHTNTLRTLLKYGCGGEDDADISGWTPLAWALYHRSLSTVQALISGTRMQIDRQDKSGRTALMWASSYGYLDVVQLLLSQGASPLARDNDGRTVVEYAQMYNYVEIIEELEGWCQKNIRSSVIN
ncbi:Nn.00g074370.m01.CDS01 [Neocucurbitaria sp. VM-36]